MNLPGNEFMRRITNGFLGARKLPPEVVDAAQARALLDIERARASRSRLPLSVIVFDTPRLDQQPAHAHYLVRTLAARIRTVDRLASFDRVRISAMLPDTPTNGATAMGERIARELGAESIDVTFRVHGEHPGDEPSPGDGRDMVGRGSLARLLERDMPISKRMLDIVGALAGLVFLAPLLLLIAVVIRWVSPGPILFRQERIGYMGGRFTMLKFRTMNLGADSAIHEAHVTELIKGGLPLEKLDSRSDRRMIPFGRFMRMTSLDELPQLINVLRGEMSLVGPRPEVPYAAKAYRPWHRLRFAAVPGMTGLWQVSGKERTTFEEMVRLDIAYTSRWSGMLDLNILLRTLPVVLLGKNGGGRAASPSN